MSENLFTKSIDQDKKLPSGQKMELKQLANLFNTALEENLFLGPFQLATKYPDIPMESWKGFLDYPPTKRIVQELSRDVMLKQAESNISKGKDVRDSIALRKSLQGETQTDNNVGYIVMMLPNKVGDLNE